MAPFVPIPLYLQIAQISQYESTADIAYNEAFKGGDINNKYTLLLRAVRRAVQWGYNWNPNLAGLPAAAIFMYQLCGKYVVSAQNTINNLTQTLPIVTGPSSQSINVAASATFTIGVTSFLPYTIAWYRNGVLIPGQNGLSYTLINAQLSDSTAQFSAIVTNGAGSTPSATGVLTVTAALSGRFYWGDTDYSADINAGNNDVAYNGTFSITTGQPLSVQFPAGAANFKYIAVEYPATESTKTNYFTPPIDSGLIPSVAFDNVKTIGAVKIIFSRSGNPFSQNTANPVIFS